MEQCPWPKAVRILFPHRAREDDLGVQVSDNELDPDQKSSTFGDFHYHYIQLGATILSSPSRFHFALPSSFSKSLQKLISSRKSSLVFSLREQSSKYPGFISLCEHVVFLFPSYRIAPALSSVRDLTLT